MRPDSKYTMKPKSFILNLASQYPIHTGQVIQIKFNRIESSKAA